jgi:DNA-directed RNA polymerase subunit RPC12/RpoP
MPEDTEKKSLPDACPHCGKKLSPWQQVLLGVDRALTCKNCWYKIIIDIHDKDQKPDTNGEKNKG